MPQYVVISSHEASQCPGANKVMGEILGKLYPQMASIGEKYGVKRIGQMVHLDPAHKLLVTLEAPNQDAVLDALNENRVAEIWNVEVYRATPLEDMFKLAERLGQQPLY